MVEFTVTGNVFEILTFRIKTLRFGISNSGYYMGLSVDTSLPEPMMSFCSLLSNSLKSYRGETIQIHKIMVKGQFDQAIVPSCSIK